MSDASSFNAGLSWASHGGGYQGLSDYLGGQGPDWARLAAQEGGWAGSVEYKEAPPVASGNPVPRHLADEEPYPVAGGGVVTERPRLIR